MDKTNYQKRVTGGEFGQWSAFPLDLSTLLTSKTISPTQFVILNFIVSSCYIKNSTTLDFSGSNIASNCNISRRTVIRSMKQLESLGLLKRHFKPSGYGETYTFLPTALIELSKQLKVMTNCHRWCDKMSQVERQNVTGGVTKSHRCGDKMSHNLRIYYNNIYSLYIGDYEVRENLDIDVQRLIDAGFTENNIMTFLELHSKNGKFDFNSISSLYAVIKQFGKDKLDHLESEMSIARRNREREIEKNKRMYLKAVNGLGGLNNNLQTENKLIDGKPSFKINL